MQCIDGFSILLQRYVAKGNDVKTPAFLAFVCYRKNRHSGKMTAHAQGRLRDFLARRNGRHNISIETNRVKMAAI